MLADGVELVYLSNRLAVAIQVGEAREHLISGKRDSQVGAEPLEKRNGFGRSPIFL